VGILGWWGLNQETLKFLTCKVELNGNGTPKLEMRAENRFDGGHSRSVTFVGMDKLNKILVSAGSDGLVVVCFVLS
jgi:hypothetical protein